MNRIEIKDFLRKVRKNSNVYAVLLEEGALNDKSILEGSMHISMGTENIVVDINDAMDTWSPEFIILCVDKKEFLFIVEAVAPENVHNLDHYKRNFSLGSSVKVEMIQLGYFESDDETYAAFELITGAIVLFPVDDDGNIMNLL
jgi:hypothetical protein